MKKVCTILRLLVNSIYYLRFKNPLVICAWVYVRRGKAIPRNWGDELNVYLLELMTGRPVVVANNSIWHILFPYKKFICIGSILGWYENRLSEIWGAGALSKDVTIKNHSTNIHLVRGKYTRQLLAEQGVACPEVYGDPALLLSRFYIPKHVKRYRMGIIPHYTEENQLFIQNFVDKNNDVCLISMSHYDVWTDVIDKIASCDFVISSSLHGLIVSDSYNVPNIWVAFSENLNVEENFKYKDYFSSVKRSEPSGPIRVRSDYDLSMLYDVNYEGVCEKPIIDFNAIIDSCPFING